MEKKGITFETDTGKRTILLFNKEIVYSYAFIDTEIVAKLTKYIYDSQKDSATTLTSLAKQVCKELEGSFAFIFKSSHFPNEIVATRRGSPLLIGVKTEKKLKVDFVDVEFGNAADSGKCYLIG